MNPIVQGIVEHFFLFLKKFVTFWGHDASNV